MAQHQVHPHRFLAEMVVRLRLPVVNPILFASKKHSALRGLMGSEELEKSL
jgi:hypothetical protein